MSPTQMSRDMAHHISQPAEVFQCSMFAPQSKSQNAAILPFEVAVRLVQVTAKSCMNRIEQFYDAFWQGSVLQALRS